MNLSDEELQSRIEKGEADFSSDATLYRKLFSALEKEYYPSIPGFAERVVSRLENRFSDRKDYVWLFLGLTSFVVAAFIAVIESHWTIELQIFSKLSCYTGVIVFGLLFILAINYIDKRWVSKWRPS